MKHLSNQTTNIQVVRTVSYSVLVREYYIEQKSSRFLLGMCEKPTPLGVGWIAQIMCM